MVRMTLAASKTVKVDIDKEKSLMKLGALTKGPTRERKMNPEKLQNSAIHK